MEAGKMALIYVRVSTRMQIDNGLSLEAQEHRLWKYAEANGLDVAEVIRDEGVSASKPLEKRPGGARMLRLLKAGKASHVLAIRLDRLFRNTREALEVIERWDKQLVALHLLDMQVNTATSVGKMIFTVLSSVAQMEREMLGERVSEVAQYKKSQRQRYTLRVYGFDNADGTMVELPEELAVVKRMKRLREQGSTLKAIAEALMADGIPAPSGKPWHAETVRRILNNDIYDK